MKFFGGNPHFGLLTFFLISHLLILYDTQFLGSVIYFLKYMILSKSYYVIFNFFIPFFEG